MERTFKHKLQPIYERIVHTVPEAIQSLLNAPSLLEVPSIRIIRNIYLPELVLALHRVHVEAGLYINRQLLIQTLELSTIVADPTRTILDTFTETGRLAEYVDEIAGASRNILGGAQDGVKGMSIWSVAT
jgi:nuclear pore complex protein Nup107